MTRCIRRTFEFYNFKDVIVTNWSDFERLIDRLTKL